MLVRATACIVLLLAAMAVAQEQEYRFWTVQTVAFPDYRQALTTSGELLQLGFDAYTEFTMSGGVQYTRVRIGCFEGREAAERMAGVLAGLVTAEAVAQPLTPGAPVTFCVHDDVGFVKPLNWAVETESAHEVTFRVQVGGHVGYVRNANDEWRMLTQPESAQPGANPQALRFEQITLAGRQLIRTVLETQTFVVCEGRLLWQGEGVAVVERERTVAACRVRPGPGSTP